MTSPQESPVSHRSVRTLLLWLVLALLLPGLGGVGFLLFVEYQKERSRLERDTVHMARAMSQTVDDRIAQTQSLAQGLANADSLAADDLAGFYKVARRTLEQTGLAFGLAVSDRSGQQVLNTALPWGSRLPVHGNLQVVERVFETGSPTLSNLFMGMVTHRPIMTVAVPVMVRNRLAYVLNVAVPPSRFKEVLDAQRLPAGWVSSVFDGNGVIVARTQAPEESVGKTVPADLLDHIKSVPEGVMDIASLDGVPVHAYYSVSPTTGWGVAVTVPRQALATQSREPLVLLALGMVAVLGVGLALAWMIGGRIAKSIQALKEPAAALGAGRSFPLPQVHVREADEVAKALAVAAQVLEKRTGELRESNRTLQAREAELAEIHRLAAFGHWQKNLRTGEVSISQSLAEIYGIDPSAFQENREALFGRQNLERVDGAARQALQTGKSYDLEMEITRRDGTPIWIRVMGDPVRDEDGEVVALRGMVQDITARKTAEAEIERLNAHLECRVEERTAELQAANRELEGFTYAVSHDLRAPMGRIANFSTLLEQQYRPALEGNGLLYLDFIRQNTTRLIQLVDDLLTHARVGRQDLALGPLEVSSLVQAVLREQAEAINAARALVKLSFAPATVLGDSYSMIQALGNLLQNALKFSAAERPAVIEIGGQGRDGRYVLWVRDNGIGFDMAYHDKIFEIFGRLHPQSAYEGSGIGLALARRAMERQGGRIWAESEPGKGATFFLDLKVRETTGTPA